MPLKASVYIATSLDGFIARQNGGIDWLSVPTQEGQDYGYDNFISTIDAIVMGRASFEKVLTFGGWPYGGKRVIVLSRTGVDIPEHLAGMAVAQPSIEAALEEVHQSGAKHLYIDGGKTIQSFLSAGLIQELTITTIPILIGDGIPLFGPLEKDIRLKHLQTTSFENGLVQTRYRVLG